MPRWTSEQARETYGLQQWGEGYFDVAEDGALVVSVNEATVAISTLIHRLREQGVGTPVLLRFVDILRDRVLAMSAAFDEAIRATNYTGSYRPLYPIKVNQQRSVVEALISQEHVGLEVGSKPELVAAMALSRPGKRIVCNGYKDREYIRLALTGRTLGLDTVIVVEKPGEVALILEESRALDTEPVLGLRLRLSTLGAGNWQNTGGERSKFGLSARHILEALDTLRDADRLDCLKLAHFHMGSQVPGIRDIQRAVREAGRFYAELRRQGAPVSALDVGGGLGVDYEGTRSRSAYSINYSLVEYARAIVNGIHEVCQEHELPEPELLTEAGRAMTAHHAVLVTDVADVERVPDDADPPRPRSSDPELLHTLQEELEKSEERSAHELAHEAEHFLAESRGLYVHGLLDLRQRSMIDAFYYALCRRALARLRPERRGDRELIDRLQLALSDKYFCNLSIFQSMPDIWAIEQVFPVVPLQRLNERPDRRVVLKDLTCDSDGRIDRYVESGGVEDTLPLHEIDGDEPYYLGFFLVGAYQETLGDIHNLFGDTHSVDVHLGASGAVMEKLRPGDSADQLLASVGYETKELNRALTALIEQAGVADERKAEIIERLQEGLSGYTYLER